MHNDLIFSYGVSVERYTEKPTKKPFFWTEKQGTVNDLLNDILRGHAYCSIFYHGAKETQEIEQSRKEKASRDGKQYASLNIKQNEFTTYSHTAKYFKQTNIISFDFDKCDTTAYKCFELLQDTEITPTFIYTSSSNGTIIDGKRNNAYRLVYIIDQPIANGEQYTAIHGHLKTEILKAVNDRTIYNDPSDTHGKAERCYYGNGSENVQYYPNGYNFKVYSLTWLVDRYNVVITETPVNDSYVSFVPVMVEATASVCEDVPFSDYSEKESQQRLDGEHIPRERKVIYDRCNANETLLNKREKKYKEFYAAFESRVTTLDELNAWTKRLPLLPTKTPLKYYMNGNNITKLYIDVDDSYFEIIEKRERVKYKFVSGNEETIWRVKKFKDGELRRQKLFNHLMMLRNITPNASREQLTLNAVNFIYRCIDNTKDPITKSDIKEKVDKALETDLSKYKYDQNGKYKRTYKVNEMMVKAFGIDKKQAALMARNEKASDRKTSKWEKIKAVYDPAKSNEEIAKELNAEGLDITPAYVQTWRRENNIKNYERKNKNEVIAEHYNVNISASENYRMMKAQGIEVSRAGVYRYAKSIQATKTNKNPNKANNDDMRAFANMIEQLNENDKKQQQDANTREKICRNAGFNDDEIEQLKSSEHNFKLWQMLDPLGQAKNFLEKK